MVNAIVLTISVISLLLSLYALDRISTAGGVLQESAQLINPQPTPTAILSMLAAERAQRRDLIRFAWTMMHQQQEEVIAAAQQCLRDAYDNTSPKWLVEDPACEVTIDVASLFLGRDMRN